MLKISVNIPTYNRAHLIRHALDSVLAQSYPHLEIIVVDDGSVDGTASVVAEYGDRVRYFFQPNGGLGTARNTGLDQSTGDLVAFLDSDDEWLPFKLELQVRVLEKLPHAAFSFSEFVILKDNGTRIPKGSRTWLADPAMDWSEIYPRRVSFSDLGVQPIDGAPQQFPIYSGSIFPQFRREALVLPTTAMVRRNVIGSLRFTERMVIFEDWEFFARLAREHECAFLDVETAVNRGHDGPERLTRCPGLVKAQRYTEMLERVWLADQDFCRRFPDVARASHADALLAIARAAVLEGKPSAARDAVRKWRDIPGAPGRRSAAAYSLLSGIPGGRALLRGTNIGRMVVQAVAGRHAGSPVNPAV